MTRELTRTSAVCSCMRHTVFYFAVALSTTLAVGIGLLLIFLRTPDDPPRPPTAHERLP